MTRLMFTLLPRISGSKRAQIFLYVLDNDDALSSTAAQVYRLQGDHDERGAQLVTAEELESLERAVATHIEAAADRGSLIDEPDLGFLLFRWIDWGGDEQAVAKWCEKQVTDGVQFVKFVKAFSQTTLGAGLDDRVARRYVGVATEAMARFVDMKAVTNQAHRLRTDDRLSEEEQGLMQAIINGYGERQPEPPGPPVISV